MFQLHALFGLRMVLVWNYNTRYGYSYGITKTSRKIKILQWLVLHKAIAVDSWLKRRGGSTSCLRCGVQDEDIRHCLWQCAAATQVINVYAAT